jgi:hypothetical protein
MSHHLAVGDLRGEVAHPAAHQIKDSAACVAECGAQCKQMCCSLQASVCKCKQNLGVGTGLGWLLQAPPELAVILVYTPALPVTAAGAAAGLL